MEVIVVKKYLFYTGIYVFFNALTKDMTKKDSKY